VLLTIIIVAFIISLLVTYRNYRKVRARAEPYNPFKETRMKVKVGCTKCNYTKTRAFKHSEYIFQEIGKCPKCGKTTIIKGIYHQKKKSRKEIKWEKWLAQWQ